MASTKRVSIKNEWLLVVLVWEDVFGLNEERPLLCCPVLYCSLLVFVLFTGREAGTLIQIYIYIYIYIYI